MLVVRKVSCAKIAVSRPSCTLETFRKHIDLHPSPRKCINYSVETYPEYVYGYLGLYSSDMEYCKKTLRLVEENYATELCRSIDVGRVSIALCVFDSLLQFSKGVYGVDLLCEPELSVLQRLRGMLQARSSTGLEGPQCPERIKSLACQWLFAA